MRAFAYGPDALAGIGGGAVLAAAAAAGLPRSGRRAAAADVRLMHGDAQHLPVRDRSVDVVFSVLCLHNLPSPAAACGEIVRVPAPGGTAVIADFQGSTAYAQAFTAAGLEVRSSRAPLREVLGPMGVVVAHARR